MSPVAVSKMHGTLNDFVVLDERSAQIVGDVVAFARRICDRRGGIGADGLIVLLPSERADARMRIINADGSEAEMCGNGMRCAVRYLSECGEGERFRIETLAGIIGAQVLEKNDEYRIRLNVGVPLFEHRALPFEDAAFVSVGNPHVVIFERSLDAIDLLTIGRRMSDVNVHLAVVADAHRLDVRHHERGVGLTNACGTGAVACAAAAIKRGLAESPVDVHVPGGVLTIEWDGAGEAFLTGPAVRVFDARV
jgi:diaminopimelate epimerase